MLFWQSTLHSPYHSHWFGYVSMPTTLGW